MRQSILPGTGLALSQIAFGTSALHHLTSRRARERLVLAARDAGITHFDTAPYYGHGLAELALAALRDPVTIATKVGLYPPGGAHGSRTRMLARKALGRLLPMLSRPLVDFSVATARASLDASLERLGRERVDLLLLHEPRIELVATEEWRRWIDSERDRVGIVGLAGEPANVLPFIAAASPFARVIQTRDSLARDEAAPLRRIGRSPQITYGNLVNRDPRASVAETLARTIGARPRTVLLVSTRRVGRIAELAHAVDAAPPAAELG